MRGVIGDSRTTPEETVNAAATAIAIADNRAIHASIQKRRWGSCLSIYSCFGSHKYRNRIGHAVLVPETTAPGTDAPAANNSAEAPGMLFPFVVPPSSPASFMQSEPPSAMQSPEPAGLLSVNTISASMYSPGGPASIFASGPYAHETQLVSPPVFSTFTTEPSTAPFTPPPESVHLTTPSSPEVPFAQLLDPKFHNNEAGQRIPFSQYVFQSYQFYPGSPVGHLISPGSCISNSGTSSPFRDSELAGGGRNFIEFQTGDPPKLLNLDKLSTRNWRSHQGSGSVTPDAPRPSSGNGFCSSHQISDSVSHIPLENGCQNDQIVINNHRVSFELTAEDVVRCMEKKPMVKAVSASPHNEPSAEREDDSIDTINGPLCCIDETSTDGEKARRHQKQQSTTVETVKDFNFDSADGIFSHKSESSSDWWVNEKVIDKTSKNWSFFPVIQPGVS